jgi:tight adherence protein B
MMHELKSLLGTDAWLMLVLGAAFLTTFLVALMLLSIREQGRQRRSLARRLLGRRSKRAEEEKGETTWMPTGLAQAGQALASVGGFSVRLDLKLEQAGVPMRAGEFVALTTLCALAGAVFGAILLSNIIFVLLIGAVASLIPYAWLVRARGKRQKKMAEQLGDVLSILASSLRAGHSFLQALDHVAKEISDPSATEFQRVVSEIRLGRSIDDAMLGMADRIGSEDLRWAVMAVNIQREVGGNLAEVLDIVATTVRERAYILRQVKVLSAEGRISIGILAALPFGIFLYLTAVNPDYIGLLFTTTIGRLLLAGGGVLMGLGIFTMTRLVKIDV